MKYVDLGDMADEADEWIKRGEHETPERMPDVDALYKAGAYYVSVESYEEESRRMVLGIMFPEDEDKKLELWLHIANCENDGVRFKYHYPLAIKMLILGPDEYIDRQALGPNAIGEPIKW